MLCQRVQNAIEKKINHPKKDRPGNVPLRVNRILKEERQ
jgi:hypothetical protein